MGERQDVYGEEVEAQLAAISVCAREEIRRKLAHAEYTEETLSELAAGAYLARLGYAPEYEREICGKTPDWYVPPREHVPAFIVEVLTKHISQEEEAEKRQVCELEVAVQQIRVPAGLSLGVRGLEPGFDPSAVAAAIENWLTTRPRSVGERTVLNDIELEVVRVGGECSARVLSRVLKPKLVHVKTLRNAAGKKVRDYKRLELPLVVAVAAKFATGYDWDDFEEALYGRRDRKGLFDAQKRLSGGMWIPRRDDRADRIRVYLSEDARMPLPKTALPEPV